MPRHTSEPETGADDFTLISGIGGAISRRLHDAGVTTYAQLAALGVDEIARPLSSITAVTTDRIRKEDWSGQAAVLAARVAGVTAERLEPLTAPTGEANAGESKQEGPEPVGSTRRPRRWRSLTGASVTVERDRRIVQAGERFTVGLTLDLAHAEPALPPMFRYSALVVARPLTGARPHTVGQGAGLFAPRMLKIQLSCAGLPAGAHRLEAVVELFESSSARATALLAAREDGLLTVI